VNIPFSVIFEETEMKHLRELAEKCSKDHHAAAAIVNAALAVSNNPSFIETVARHLAKAAAADIAEDRAIVASLSKVI
jgi:hypothetical protein